MGSEDLYKHYSVPVWQCSANYNLGYETVCRGERARAKFSAPFRGIVVGGGGQVVRQKGWLLLGGQPFFFASLVVGRFTDEEMHQCYDQNSSLYNDLKTVTDGSLLIRNSHKKSVPVWRSEGFSVQSPFRILPGLLAPQRQHSRAALL